MTLLNKDLALKDIGHVIVEVIPKDALGKDVNAVEAEKKMINGLFGGLRVLEDRSGKSDPQLMMSIITGKDESVFVNTDKHSFIMLKVVKQYTEYLTVYRSDEVQQKSAMEMILEIHDVLMKEGYMIEADELINLDKYSLLPEKFGGKSTSIVSSTSKPATKVQGGHSATNKRRQYPQEYDDYNDHSIFAGAGSRTNSAWNTKKEPTPVLFKRNGKRLAKKTLERNKALVMAIAEGEYEPKKVIVLPGDEEKSSKKA